MKYVTYNNDKYYLLDDAVMSDDGKTYQARAISVDGRNIYNVYWKNLYADVPMAEWPLGEGEDIMCDWDVICKVEHLDNTGASIHDADEMILEQKSWDEEDLCKNFDFTEYAFWIIFHGCDTFPVGFDTHEEALNHIAEER